MWLNDRVTLIPWTERGDGSFSSLVSELPLEVVPGNSTSEFEGFSDSNMPLFCWRVVTLVTEWLSILKTVLNSW